MKYYFYKISNISKIYNKTYLKITSKPSNCTKIILPWQVTNILPKGAIMNVYISSSDI